MDTVFVINAPTCMRCGLSRAQCKCNFTQQTRNVIGEPMPIANFDPDDVLPLPTMAMLNPSEQRKQIHNVPPCTCNDSNRCMYCGGGGFILGGARLCPTCLGSGIVSPAVSGRQRQPVANRFDPDDVLPLPVMNWNDDKQPEPQTVTANADDSDGLPLPVMVW